MTSNPSIPPILLIFSPLPFVFGTPKYIFFLMRIGELAFNRLLGNGLSDLNDFYGRFPRNFNSDEMLKKISPLARLRPRACIFCITGTADFSLFWPKLASGIFGGTFFSFGVINFKFWVIDQQCWGTFEIMPITPKFCQKYDMRGRVREVGSLSARAKMAMQILSNSYLLFSQKMSHFCA